MSVCLSNSFLASITVNPVSLRMGGMFVALIVGLAAGYVIGHRMRDPVTLAKDLMNFVTVSLNWMVALVTTWDVKLTRDLVWLPIVAAVLMIVLCVFSSVLFGRMELSPKRRLTLILAGGLSNISYTGGAFVCYGLFGASGLALANIYPLIWVPLANFIFFPLLKAHDLKFTSGRIRLTLADIFDPRLLALPATIAAIILNLASVPAPRFLFDYYIVDVLVYSASALSFFAIGLQVKVSNLKNYINLYFLVSAIKFVLAPVAAGLLIWLLALAGQELTAPVRNVIIVLSFSPSAVLMVTMSNIFDLDSPLASALWVVTNIAFIAIVVPLLFFIFV